VEPVTDVLVHLGDTVLPGAVIASAADLSAYQIETTDVDQFLVAQLRPGQTVTASIEAINKRNLTGTVHTVAVEPVATSSGNEDLCRDHLAARLTRGPATWDDRSVDIRSVNAP
jgi:hypothetical protein